MFFHWRQPGFKPKLDCVCNGGNCVYMEAPEWTNEVGYVHEDVTAEDMDELKALLERVEVDTGKEAKMTRV